MGSALGKGLCPWQLTGWPWANLGPLLTFNLYAQCAEGPKGEKGASGALVSMGAGVE